MLHDFPTILAQTLDDRRLSRGERQAIAELLAAEQPSRSQRAVLRSQIFKAARERMVDPRDHDILDWLEELMKLFFAHERDARQRTELSEVCFSPGGECSNRISDLFDGARICVDICVFTITDDRIVRSILAAYDRGVRIRVLSDLEKSADPGSDVDALRERGIEVAYDRDEKHMHHKFAVFDRALLLTGSYNWTRSAADLNNENIVITRERPLVERFLQEFDALWSRYAG